MKNVILGIIFIMFLSSEIQKVSRINRIYLQATKNGLASINIVKLPINQHELCVFSEIPLTICTSSDGKNFIRRQIPFHIGDFHLARVETGNHRRPHILPWKILIITDSSARI